MKKEYTTPKMVVRCIAFNDIIVTSDTGYETQGFTGTRGSTTDAVWHDLDIEINIDTK